VLHPGGRIGKKLLRVEDLMHTGDAIPRVRPDTIMKDVLFEMTRKRLGLTTVTEATGLHQAGLRTGVLSGRSSETVERRVSELGMAVVSLGVRDKLTELHEILGREGLEAREVAYIGDDVNDLPVLTEVGLSAAPADAPMEVRLQTFMVMDAPGGRGCLREFIEAILRARGDWDRVTAAVGASVGTP
jgi:YrbI family 3-deoxy-D-manno-octulosonate 8-phosphate phosphatase